MVKKWLKLCIGVYFSMGIVVFFSFVMFVSGKTRFEYCVPLSLGFICCLALYHFVLKDEFEKMQKQYEKAGSVKKTIKKWKEGDTE